MRLMLSMNGKSWTDGSSYGLDNQDDKSQSEEKALTKKGSVNRISKLD